jgi:selenocysteine lyase/cysteine desulfurase
MPKARQGDPQEARARAQYPQAREAIRSFFSENPADTIQGDCGLVKYLYAW